MSRLRIGTRASALALAQTRLVAEELGDAEIVPLSTSGDRDAGGGDKSRWVDTIEDALLAHEIDLAVHSAKDLPGELADGLELLGAPARAGVEDVLCGARDLDALAPAARVGTSSIRRAAQLRAAREDLDIVAMGGNVDTRLRLLAEGKFDAIVLARAGLQRLGRENEIGAVLDPARFVPAPGQGALALETRADDTRVREAVAAILDTDTSACLLAERALASALDASCHTPLGAYATPAGCGCFGLRAWVGLPDGSAWVADELLGGFYDPAALGTRVAERMTAAGARELLTEAGRQAPFRAGRSEDAGRTGDASVSECHPGSAASVALIGSPFRPARRRGQPLPAPESRSTGAVGRVYLVGAGPGDPGLLTARALELIAVADVILYDRLIPAAALDGASAEAELLFVGKQGGGDSVPQEQTEELMIAHARAGKTVVRLKGGDPFVFGRGGEEALRLRGASIPYEIVPGVTAGVAAAAYAGIPVTHRGLSIGVALVTGHEDPEKDETSLDWAALAAFPGTLVFYMGVRALPTIARALIDAGRPQQEPVAIVERATLPGQRTLTGTLSTIAELARAEDVRAPSITIVGPVAALAKELSWLEPAPLAGLTIAVTRARASASGLARRLEKLGARVIQAPTIRTAPLPGRAPDLTRYDLVCLTSPVGVDVLFGRLRASGHDARALAGARVAAIGPGTAERLAGQGILADVVPERALAEGLVEALAELRPPVKRALIARASEGRETLPDALRARGVEVDVLALYETLAEEPPAHVLQEALAANYLTFTSASTVRFFSEAIAGIGEGLSPDARIVSIGPITSGALREHGLEPHVEALSHDIDGLVRALLADVRTRIA